MKNKSVLSAKDRLKALLVSDRVDCTPDTFEKIKLDLYHTVSKYLNVNQEYFEVKINRSDIHIRLTGEDL